MKSKTKHPTPKSQQWDVPTDNIDKDAPLPTLEYNPDDNWANRMAGRRCKLCIHYVAKAGGIGRCRRRAPTIEGYPVVFDQDWCGEFKLDECK